MSDLGGLIFQFEITQAQQHLTLTSSQVCQGECAHFRLTPGCAWYHGSSRFAHTSETAVCCQGV